jgi:glycosyltransferase involved in cell wall biosynthesis
MKLKENNVESLLTAIIPIGNTGGNLELLYSWLPEASKYPISIIIVHDVLDNVTGPLLNDLREDFKVLNLTFIEGRFGCPGEARNAGLALAQTDWISFWDHDDKPILGSIFKSIYEATSEDEILIGEFTIYNSIHNSVKKILVPKPSFETIAMNPGVWRMVFKRSAIHDLRFTNLKMGEDQVFLSDIKLPDRRVKFIAGVFYEYTFGGNNQLTRDLSKLSNLELATKYIYGNTSKNLSNSLIYFNMHLIIRQQITLIKNKNMSLRFGALRFLVKLFLKPKSGLFWYNLRSLSLVLMNIKKFRLK